MAAEEMEDSKGCTEQEHWTKWKADIVSGFCLKEHLWNVLTAPAQLCLGKSAKQELNPDDVSLTSTRT